MKSLNAADMGDNGVNDAPVIERKTIATSYNYFQLSLNDKSASYTKPPIHQ